MSQPNLQKAEDDLKESTERLDSAMGQLGDKVGETLGKAQEKIHSVKHPKETALHMMNQGREKASVYASQMKETGKEWAERVKQNPDPYVKGAIAALAGALVGIMFDRLMSRKKTVIYYPEKLIG